MSMDHIRSTLWVQDFHAKQNKNGDLVIDPEEMLQHMDLQVIVDAQDHKRVIQVIQPSRLPSNVTRAAVGHVLRVHWAVPALAVMISFSMIILTWMHQLPVWCEIGLTGIMLLTIMVGGLFTVYDAWCREPLVHLFELNFAFLFTSVFMIAPLVFWMMMWNVLDAADRYQVNYTFKMIGFTIVTQLFWMNAEFVCSRSHVTGIGARFMFPTQLCVSFLQFMAFGWSTWSWQFVLQIVWVQLNNMFMMCGFYERLVAACRPSHADVWEHRNIWDKLQRVIGWKYRMDLYAQDMLAEWSSKGVLWIVTLLWKQDIVEKWKVATTATILDEFELKAVTVLVVQVLSLAVGWYTIIRWATRDVKDASVTQDDVLRMLESLGYPVTMQATILDKLNHEYPELFGMTDSNQVINKWLVSWSVLQHFVYMFGAIMLVTGVLAQPQVLFGQMMIVR